VIAPQTCPICSKPVSAESGEQSTTFPFCSVRCQQVDLLRWSKGTYRIVDPLDPRELEQETSSPEE
jgi:endogenous inhibitor of DNA gyrase (YacG/DUF329 family)